MINLMEKLNNPDVTLEILLNDYRSIESAKDVVYKYIDICDDEADFAKLTYLYGNLKKLLADLDATISWLQL